MNQEELKESTLPHGQSRYVYGCRCDVCKSAVRAYQKKYREFLKERDARWAPIPSKKNIKEPRIHLKHPDPSSVYVVICGNLASAYGDYTLTEDWSKVTCKRCLVVKPKE